MSEWVTQKKTFDAGEDLFLEGQAPCDAYLIESGRVEVTKIRDGVKVILGHRDVGDVVGEMALIDNSPRSATATAVEPTVCIIITQKLFDEHMARLTPLLRQVLKTFTRNLRFMGDQFATTRS